MIGSIRNLFIQSGRFTDPRIGILWLLLAMLLVVTMDVLVKDLTQRYTIQQVAWARFLGHFALPLLLLGTRIVNIMKSERFGLQILRSIMLAATTFCFFSALSRSALASVSAVMFLTPIIVTLLAWPLLREPVGMRRWIGVLIGFSGALLIILTQSDAVSAENLLQEKTQTGIFFAILAAFLFAFYQIATRILSQYDSPLTTSVHTPLMGLIFFSLFVWQEWIMPTWIDGFLMLLTGIVGGCAHFSIIKAYQSADTPTLAPFSYTSLIWAILFGFIGFNEIPDQWVLVGAGLICASGLYIAHREHIKTLERQKAASTIK